MILDTVYLTTLPCTPYLARTTDSGRPHHLTVSVRLAIKTAFMVILDTIIDQKLLFVLINLILKYIRNVILPKSCLLSSILLHIHATIANFFFNFTSSMPNLTSTDDYPL